MEKIISKVIIKQLSNNFLKLSGKESKIIIDSLKKISPDIISHFNKINSKYYQIINPYHSGQMFIILYKLSYYIQKNYNLDILADKIYYLNKIMNCIDVYHKVKLPEVFNCEHPVGSVLGKAEYSDYFMFYQNCTVGGNYDKENKINYPKFGKNVTLFSYSSILGNCNIGNNVIFSSHAYIKDTDIPDNSIVFGIYPNITIKPNNKKNLFFKD